MKHRKLWLSTLGVGVLISSFALAADESNSPAKLATHPPKAEEGLSPDKTPPLSSDHAVLKEAPPPAVTTPPAATTPPAVTTPPPPATPSQ